MSDHREVEVRAGGGLVQRDDGRVLVVHRPRYDDWTFPKGKLESGETIEQCALREVVEETGFECELGDPVATIHYTDHKGRLKEVRYWWMKPVTGAFEPNDEVDEVAWLDLADLAAILSYRRDYDVLVAATDNP